MKLIIIVTAVSGLAAAAPALVNLGAVLPSNALRAVHTSATTKAPSVATPAASSATAHPSITIAPSAASVTYPTAFPSSFSAPVQGQGKLALDNLPALPPVLDKTLVGVLGVVVGLGQSPTPVVYTLDKFTSSRFANSVRCMQRRIQMYHQRSRFHPVTAGRRR